ncbi:MAG: SIR2 family protein [Dysgonamonadaceae bacterium]|nr:SIR2 family protein [Dysgonamonadaceae bacterium]
MNIKSIYTTNIDNLIFEIFEQSGNKYLNDVSHNGRISDDISAINYSALHGCILFDDRKLIFDVSSLNNAYDNSPRVWDSLSQDVETTPTLFWGYSLSDTGVIQSLTSRHALKDAQKEKWIILRKEEEDSALFYEAMGFNIIISDTDSFLNYLASIEIAPIKKTSESEEIKYIFNKNLVPKSSKGLSVRPISEFIKGNPPIWSDIYSGQIYRTSFFSEIQNKILSKKNNIVLGGPVTGKSTLMMQLAAFISFEGNKFVFNNIDNHKADFLINILGKKTALIFIDNFADSIESFVKLSKINNFILVGFERGHNYGIVSHLLNDTEYEYTNITELKDTDIQGIYDLLPIDQKRSKLQRSNGSEYGKDSIFEFISRNVKYPTIEDRYRSVLKELDEKDSLLAEFLVLISYVHHSRVPLSFDMLYSYFSDDIETYDDIYQMRDDLKDMVKDYSGDLLLEEDQDYYYPRSMFSAETVLKVADIIAVH